MRKKSSEHHHNRRKFSTPWFYTKLVFVTVGLFFLSQADVTTGLGEYELTIKRPLVQGVSVDVPTPAPYPVKVNGYPQPTITAKGAIVIDVNSQRVLYERGSHTRLYPASTTKILTALVSLGHYQQQAVLTTSREHVEGSILGLKPGEKMTVRDLLRATLISSSNDAALVLADNYPGGEQGFVKAMNEMAREMNLTESQFKNPTGLHHPDHFSTPRDLARLGAIALKNNQLKTLVNTRETVVTNLTTNQNIPITNLNQLLGTIGVDGIKTGYTEEAGGCLVATKQVGGRRVISVVLGSEDRFLDSDLLLSFVFNSYRW
jgi:D-alanyl-D-alanine carboxypeptidase (penicillin-binding protein 5/6)